MPETVVNTGVVEKLYSDGSSLLKFLAEKNEPSFQVLANDFFRKSLVLSAASYFEHEISEAMRMYPIHRGCDPAIVNMIKLKAVDGQYFKYFAWEVGKAGSFFGLFGEPLGVTMKQECATEPLKSALAAFLEIGNLRNCMVHQNYAAFTFEMTAEDVFAKYQLATKFIAFVKTKLT